MEEVDAKTPEFCLSQLRDLNYDRYLACLYLPERLRNLAITLYAFDAEITKISAAISEPMTGEIRIQWWRDTICASVSNTHNPLADELLRELTAHKLPLLPLDTYLQARIFDLYNDPMPDLGTLEGYCGETASVFIQLLTVAAKLGQDRTIADICGHAGMVLALTDILRFLPQHTARNKLYIPNEILEAASLNSQGWFADERGAAHLKTVDAVQDIVRDHLTKLRHLMSERMDENADLSLILLPVSLCEPYLKSVGKLGDKIFVSAPEISPFRKHWALWRSARTAKI